MLFLLTNGALSMEPLWALANVFHPPQRRSEFSQSTRDKVTVSPGLIATRKLACLTHACMTHMPVALTEPTVYYGVLQSLVQDLTQQT